MLNRSNSILSYPQRNSPDQILQIAHESIHVALAGGLVDDVLVVVVTQTAAQFLVVHLWLVLANAPSTGHLKSTRERERERMRHTLNTSIDLFDLRVNDLPHPDR